MTKPTPARIVFLDYMRIFAFLSVLVGHKFFGPLEALSNDASVHVTLRTLAEAFLPLCRGGAVGVMVFFFTSGYIITHVLQKEAAPDFVVRRVFRIYPLYIFAVLAEALAAGTSGSAFPTASVLVPRLLLLGDFFHTPYALEGVEWTLRLEILFYALMAALKAAGVLSRPRWLPALFAGIAAALYVASPFPNFAVWSDGYVNLYGPFLLMGSLIYLAQHRFASRWHCAASGIFMLVGYLILVARIQPGWSNSNYALFALALFLGAWAMRDRITAGPAVRLLSDLTFAVYLFHNWLWAYGVAALQRTGLAGAALPLAVLGLLLLFCYAAHRIVERPGIALGRKVLAPNAMVPVAA